MRSVLLNPSVVASPRISTAPEDFDFPASAGSVMERKDSLSPPWICSANVPGISGEGIIRKDSWCEMADAVALGRPWLSMLRYLLRTPC